MSLQKVVNGIVGIPLVLLAFVVCLIAFTFASSGISKSEAGPYAVGFANATGKEAAVALTFHEQVGKAFGAGFGETWAISHPSVPEEQVAGAEQPVVVNVPAATPAPIVVPAQQPPVRSSDESEQALTTWLEGNLAETRRRYSAALRANPQDLLAKWLANFDEKNCKTGYATMTGTTPDSRANLEKIRSAAGNVLATCNPRLRAAFVVGRMTNVLLAVDNAGNITNASTLKGLEVAVVSKSGAPRRVNEGDAVAINITTFANESFEGFPQLKITAGGLNSLLGRGAWEVGKNYTIPGEPMVPTNLPEPEQPSEAELQVPHQAPDPPATTHAG